MPETSPGLPAATIDIPHHPTEGLGMVMADPTQIHQVLMNLCTNAADAMREKGGTLDISLAEHGPAGPGPRRQTHNCRQGATCA